MFLFSLSQISLQENTFKIFITLSLFTLFNTSQAQNSAGFNARYSSADGAALFTGHNHINTSDNNVVIVGECNQTPSVTSSILLMKINQSGNVVWSKKITPALQMDNYKISSLSDGSILVAENSFLNDAPYYSVVFLYKFNCQGELLWSKFVNLDSSTPQADNFFTLINMDIGANNDILVSLMNKQNNAVVGRLDSLGNVIWSKTFIGDSAYQYNAQCFFLNNKVIVLGLKSALDDNLGYNKDFFAMGLNYNDGSVEIKKDYYGSEFITNFGYVFSTWNDQFTGSLIQSNKFALSGIFYDFSATDTYLYNIVLDSNFSYISSETFTNILTPDDAGYYKTQVFKNGKINIIGYDPFAPQLLNWYGADSMYNTTKQISMPFNYEFVDQDFTVKQNGPNGSSLLLSYANNNSTRYIDYAKFDDGDSRIGNCLGKSSNFITPQSWSITPESWTWKSIISNEINAVSYTAAVSDIIVNAEFICSPAGVISADSLKIKGDSNICLPVSTILYKAISNSSSLVTWKLSDSSPIKSITVLNDSMISIQPSGSITKSINIVLYATQGACKILKDSLSLHIYPQNQKLPDTLAICNGSFRLQPGSWFMNYEWQDGATDSFYVASGTGLYTVQLTNYCGNIINDTSVFLTKNPGHLINLSTCKGDTLILKLPPGLTNYQWLPDSNLYTITDSAVKVFPITNTTYYGLATTLSGCNYTDTNIISINTPRQINLGNDTSVCLNDYLILDAGSGFLNYKWNTGDSGETYKVINTGIYSVITLNSNGCYSKDTIVISAGICNSNSINIPSGFTPNHDGINDLFKPIVEGNIEKIEFEIYNRWGQIIFSTTARGKGWDGNFMGEPQKTGTYVWRCVYKFTNDIERIKKGYVIMIR